MNPTWIWCWIQKKNKTKKPDSNKLQVFLRQITEKKLKKTTTNKFMFLTGLHLFSKAEMNQPIKSYMNIMTSEIKGQKRATFCLKEGKEGAFVFAL